MAQDDAALSQEEIEFMAQRVGLGRTWADFPEDVKAAVNSAAAISKQIQNASVTEEDPWPTMQVPAR